MKNDFKGEPFDRLLTSFVNFYTGVVTLKCIFKNVNDAPQSLKKYLIDMNFNSSPRNRLEALGQYIFGKKANEDTLDKYTAAKLWKSGKSFVNDRITKIAKIKSGSPGTFWENIAVLQSRFQVHNSNFKCLRKAMLVWDKLETDEKAEAINIAYSLIMQADFDNELETELIALNNELMATANVDGTYSVSNYAKKFLKKLNILPLKEDDIAPDAQSVMSSPDSTLQSTSSIAAHSEKLFGGKLIRRRIKKFKCILYKDPNKRRSNENNE